MPSNRRLKVGKAATARGRRSRNSHPIHSASHSRNVSSVVTCPYCNGSHTVTVPRESIVRTVRCRACGKLIHSPGENARNLCPCVLCTYGSEGCGRNRP
ncbi:hypothetical protein HY995_00745 [Candidatus Micrarchaeota archaeon]|nr:hypothetical protein [Candidatus Micrarchaeota archaeon]MBI5176595.1 hypothetical protein [Candidatus Micrarchaeota archaeon]